MSEKVLRLDETYGVQPMGRKGGAPEPPPGQVGVLVGWHKIAGFLGLSVAAARVWHYRRGMPILRGPSNRPVAIPAQIYLWLIEYDKIKRAKGIKFKSNLPQVKERRRGKAKKA